MQPAPTIDYRTPQATRPISRWWIRSALICALGPMLAGILTILLWLATFSRLFVSIGGWILWLGLLLFAFGSVSLLVHVVLSISRKAKGWIRTSVIAAVLLLLNFPLAFACITAGGCWHVTVVNKTDATVSGFTIMAPRGQAVAVPDISPGGRQSVWFNPRGEGEITFTAQLAGSQSSGTLAGYVTWNMPGERKVVTFKADGTVHVP